MEKLRRPAAAENTPYLPQKVTDQDYGSLRNAAGSPEKITDLIPGPSTIDSSKIAATLSTIDASYSVQQVSRQYFWVRVLSQTGQ